MKYLKMFGLAAMAATALMAFVGAGTASATVLCKNNLNTEKCSEPYPAGTKIEATSIGTAKLDTSFKTIECNKVSGSGKLLQAGSSTTTPVGGEGTVTFSECNCEVKVLKTGTGEIHHIAGTDNGTLTSTGAEATVSCSTIFGTVHCIYASNNTDAGTLTGGNPAKEKVTMEVPRLPTSGLCSEQATVTAEYEVTSPKPLYVAAS
jgi:hypothetical protein